MKLDKPLCPKCGCPPRYIVGAFEVRMGIVPREDDGFRRTGKRHVGRVLGNVSKAECGGGHRWNVEVEEDIDGAEVEDT
jgi:hypothetical protein